jgi:hypothetical protein
MTTRTFAEDIVETSQTTGTGTYDLDGAKGDYRSFRQGYADGDTPVFWVRNANNTKSEKNRLGTLTYGAPDRLSRNVVLSTNGNAPVSWTTADLPLTIYVVRDSDVDEGAITGWLAAARHAVLRAGARWWNTAAGLAVSWVDTLYIGTADVRVGLFDAVKALYFPDNRRSSTAVGAANKVFAAADIGGSFTFNTTAAARTATLPPSAAAKDGYQLELKGLSAANGIVLTPDAGDGIDGGADGVTKTIPGGVLLTVRWDAAADRWTTDYTAPLRSYIAGLTYQNNFADATNDVDIAAGVCMDSGGTYQIVLSAMTKRLDAAWAVGTNQGGLDTGAIGNNDYYIWAIGRSDTGVADALFSLSSTAPTMPASYDKKRLFGWFKRSGGTIVAFTTCELAGGGLQLLHTVPRQDVSLANTLTATRRTDALSVPLNFSVIADILVSMYDASAAGDGIVYCPDQGDLTPTNPATGTGLATNTWIPTVSVTPAALKVRTDATGKVAARSTVATTDVYNVTTHGFLWSRR